MSPLDGGGSDDRATTDVVDDRVKPLTSTGTCLYSALVNYKACSTGQNLLLFVQQFTSLRAAALSCHSQLFTTCQSLIIFDGNNIVNHGLYFVESLTTTQNDI